MKCFRIFTLLLVLATLCVQGLVEPPRKNLAGPPETFQSHEMPTPPPTFEKSAFYEFDLDQEIEQVNANGKLTIVKLNKELEIPVDAEKEHFVFTVGSPHQHLFQYHLYTPSGIELNLKDSMIKEKYPFGVGNSVDVTTFSIKVSESGFYRLVIVAVAESTYVQNNVDSVNADGFVLIFSDDDLEIETKLQSDIVAIGKEINFESQIVHNDGLLGSRAPVITIEDAVLNVQHPEGHKIKLNMNDQGLYGDSLAGDGILTAMMIPDKPGNYFIQSKLCGSFERKGKKIPFCKTVQNVIAVSPDSLEVSNHASLSKKDEERVIISVDVNVNQLLTKEDKFRAYTEVYATKEHKGDTPVAWLGKIVNVEENKFTLELNMKWLSLANAKGPLYLKNTYLTDVSTEFPITDSHDAILIEGSENIHHEFSELLNEVHNEITPEMRYGVKPLKSKNSEGNHGLILVHGYCSSVNPFKQDSDLFDNGYFFEDKNANRNNDKFALLVNEFAESNNLDSFSIVAHSQGGMASLHLLNHYWTGLDNTDEIDTRIQTVGTPWKGNSGAGSTASIGKIFGITCGANSDLTISGAKNWYSQIDDSLAQYVSYYTTTYKQGKLFGDYCNMAMNALLEWPNDGTTEYDFAHLQGAKFMGNKEKQCHTTNMKYTAQYHDRVRNAEMNKNSAKRV